MNEQVLRPQHLTQVGHEGNPVEFFVDIVGTLDSPNPFDADGADLGGPVLYPRTGTGGSGGSEPPTSPMVLSADGDMDCAGAQAVTLTAVGGVAPYTWSTTSGNITNDGTNVAVLTPPTNTNPTYSPGSIAFGRVNKYVYACAGGGPCACRGEYYNCAGTKIQGCTASTTNDCILTCGAGWRCSGFYSSTTPTPTKKLSSASSCFSQLSTIDLCAIDANTVCSCDLRDVIMQGNGCLPCDVSFHSAAVSVTDALGNAAYVTVERNVNTGGP